MPNHCHVLIETLENILLGKIELSWKNYTARFIHDYINQTDLQLSKNYSQKNSPVWHRDYWDRYIRDKCHFLAVLDYIVMNPVKAGLVAQPDDWARSSAKESLVRNQ